MTNDQLTELLQQLQVENAMLRKVRDDERNHLTAFRDAVRRLQRNLSMLNAEVAALKTENAQLRRGIPNGTSAPRCTPAPRRRKVAIPLMGAVGLTLIGAWLLPRSRSTALPN